MVRDGRLPVVLLAALVVASVATLGGAAFGQSATLADGTHSSQTNGAVATQTAPTNDSGDGDG